MTVLVWSDCQHEIDVEVPQQHDAARSGRGVEVEHVLIGPPAARSATSSGESNFAVPHDPPCWRNDVVMCLKIDVLKFQLHNLNIEFIAVFDCFSSVRADTRHPSPSPVACQSPSP